MLGKQITTFFESIFWKWWQGLGSSRQEIVLLPLADGTAESLENLEHIFPDFPLFEIKPDFAAGKKDEMSP